MKQTSYEMANYLNMKWHQASFFVCMILSRKKYGLHLLKIELQKLKFISTKNMEKLLRKT